MIKSLFLVCALGLPAQESVHPLTDEAKVFQFLQTYTDQEIRVIKKPWDAVTVIQSIRDFKGIVLLESVFGELRGFFNSAGWHRLPFRYGSYEIYTSA